ncbi:MULTISPECIES: peptidase inhibitor family I36 protein [unclassified Frankia]|uniref:peptidase inhibitor family I36 protein n=1 Tax=unclassified Frankia TaxID=2632575 RepID=UPI002AD222DC|nr:MULTISPECIES: peptidase inhibitor family I36 protein [unclassified Frankia]
MRIKRSFIALAAVAACLGTGLGVAAPANAATGKNGVLESGEFGLYYLQNQGGYVFDLYVSDSNFANDVFPGTSISANDNTESYKNRDTYWWHVFTNANYTGSHGCLPAGYSGNASATFKNTISSAYYSSSSC